MAERLIWKKDMSQDFIKTLSDEEIINELIKHGIDLDMVNTLDREDLLKAVDSLSELYYSDLEDFENKIVPMINKQTLNGMIIMSDGNKVIPTLTELMLDGIYPLSYLEGKLIDDGSGLILEADDGTQYKLYGIPEDGLELANFVNECLPGLREDAVDDLIDQGYDESAAEEMVMNEALYEYLRDEETIESYCYPAALDEYRPRIVNELTTNESLGESMSDLEKLDSFLGIDDVEESLTEAGFFDKLTGKGNPPVTAILRIKHFNEYTNGAKGLPKVKSLFTRSRNGSNVLHDVAYSMYDLSPESYEISSRVKLGDKEFEKQNANFLKAVKNGEDKQLRYLDADKLLAEKNKKNSDDIAEVEKARKEGEKEAQLKKEYAERQAQQKARNDADDKKSRDRFTSKQAARNNQTTYNSTKDEYYESLEEAKKKVVATVTYTYDGSDRAYSDDDDAYKYWCEEIECRPSSLKKKGIGKGDKFTADIVQYDDDDVGIINIKKVTNESLTEDADEYYVVSVSDMGGNSDYIKGPMTKEEATDYAKTLRKTASKYYKEKYLVYPKNRIPGRYKHLLDNESLQESISLDQADREKLVDELSQIKSMDRNKLYNIDLLTTDLSDGSVEELFPVTTKLIVSFLSEMANITKEELADKDQINIWWTDGDLFDDRDWEALFNGADKLINGKKRVLWKVYYSPYLDEDLNSDVYNALSDVAYDYEVNKNEPVYVDDFEEAEKNFNDKYFDGLTRDDYDESLNESLSNELQNKIKEICDVMIANLEKEDLEYIIEEPPYSEDGILSNDDLADLDGDESEIAEFAINYIKSKI